MLNFNFKWFSKIINLTIFKNYNNYINNSSQIKYQIILKSLENIPKSENPTTRLLFLYFFPDHFLFASKYALNTSGTIFHKLSQRPLRIPVFDEFELHIDFSEDSGLAASLALEGDRSLQILLFNNDLTLLY